MKNRVQALQLHTYVCISLSLYVYIIHICMHIYIYTCIDTYTRMCTHVYVCMYMYACLFTVRLGVLFRKERRERAGLDGWHTAPVGPRVRMGALRLGARGWMGGTLRGPTQRPKQSAGARRTARRGPTRRAPGPDRQGAGARHPEQQPTRDSAICYSKKEGLATCQRMHFCPHCLGSVLV